jgi:carbonic anhydrase
LRIDRLCELNVVDQVRHVCHTTIVRDAWQRGQEVTVHGWIYDVADGLLRDLRCTASNDEQLTRVYDRALEHTARLVAAETRDA